MKPPDAVRREHVGQWLAKADVDYRTAERLVNDPDPIRESIAFHCQQTVEKYLKAFLVSLRIEFPKTHDLEKLLDLLIPVRPELAADLDGVKILSPFGVALRYPGDFPELLPGQEWMILEVAYRTRQVIAAHLAPYLERR